MKSLQEFINESRQIKVDDIPSSQIQIYAANYIKAYAGTYSGSIDNKESNINKVKEIDDSDLLGVCNFLIKSSGIKDIKKLLNGTLPKDLEDGIKKNFDNKELDIEWNSITDYLTKRGLDIVILGYSLSKSDKAYTIGEIYWHLLSEMFLHDKERIEDIWPKE